MTRDFAFAHGPAEVARLILEHPDLPVLEMVGGWTCDGDAIVLELAGARLGTWWLAGGRVFADYEDACHALGDDWTGDDDAVMPDDMSHGPCIWLRMDYWGANNERD